MVNFPLPVKATISDEFKMPTRIVQFGDRYKERTPDGLNRPIEVWNVEVAFASETAGANLQAFLVEHGQWKPFKWQSPRDSSPQDYCIKGNVGGSFRRGGGSKPVFFTRTLKFERVWDAFALPPVVVPPPYVPPVVPPSSPLVSVAASGTTGWTITRSGVASAAMTVNYSLSVTPDGGSATVTSGTISIPSGSGSGFVSISTNAASTRNEVLTVNIGIGYVLGNPSSASIAIAPALPIVSVSGNGSTGWIISCNPAPTNPITVSYTININPQSGGSSTTTGSVNISSTAVNVARIPIDVSGNFWLVTTPQRSFVVGNNVNPPQLILANSSSGFNYCSSRGNLYVIGYPNNPVVDYGFERYSAYCIEDNESAFSAVRFTNAGNERLNIAAGSGYVIGSASATITF